MKRRTAFLAGCIAAALCVPVGFAIAQTTVPTSDGPATETLVTHEDPDPSTDPVQQMEALNRAHADGDAEAEAKAVADLREEILSRMPDNEREAAESSPQEVAVPPGTKSYIPPALPDAIVANCKVELSRGSDDELCVLILLRAEGKIRSGAFSAAEQDAIIREAM